MKWIILVFALAAGLRAAPPNIVLVIADDLGYGDLSCYGQGRWRTPVLDGLAENGVRFTDHYSGSTVCAPSRTALMTGRDTGHCSVRGNGAFQLEENPGDFTVAQLLKQAGYRTAMIGKSCVTGNTQDPDFVLTKGFDVFYGTTSHEDGHFRYPKFVYDQAEKVELPGNSLHEGDRYDAGLYVERAEAFIREVKNGPFFLVLSLPIPHASVLAPKGGVVELEGDFDHLPEKFHYTPTRSVKGNWAGMVLAIDGYVGRVVKALEESGVGDDTLIIFSSDNGPHFEGGMDPEVCDSNGPLRGGKRDLYEGGIRVPTIAHWPKGIANPGRASAHPSAFWDFLPTCAELVGAEPPEGIQGISYASTLTGRGVQREHEALYWEFHERGGRRALRQGNWKLVQDGLDPMKFGKPELYDLSQDLGEIEDLAAKHPQRVEAMLARMAQSRVPSDWFPLPALDELDGSSK